MGTTNFPELFQKILTPSEVGIISNPSGEILASQEPTPILAGPLPADAIIRSASLPSAQAQDATITVSAFTKRCWDVSTCHLKTSSRGV